MRIIVTILFLLALACPVSATTYTAPNVPDSGAYIFPEEAESFGEGLRAILRDALALLEPAAVNAAGTCIALIAIAMLTALVNSFSPAAKQVTETVGTLSTAALLLQPAGTMIRLAADTVCGLSEYGKLLFPVLAGAVAAQGGAGTSAALYTGTVIFDTVISSFIAKIVVPLSYVFLSLGIASAAIAQDVLRKLQDFAKWLVTWFLKNILYVFTGYMSITGVISGTADASALKVAKMTISGMVPVVGGILADASEAFLVSTAVIKGAAGIYGVFAILSVAIGPFIQIGMQYLLLKITAGICTIFGTGRTATLIQDFSTTMGIMLGATGAICILQLISTVCFMRGVGA